jgi:hypothetical protein
LADGSLVKPQFAHAAGNAAPHWAQKRLVAAFSDLQLGQRIRGTPAVRAKIKHNLRVKAFKGRI